MDAPCNEVATTEKRNQLRFVALMTNPQFFAHVVIMGELHYVLIDPFLRHAHATPSTAVP